MNTRNQTQKALQQAQSQRKLSTDTPKNIDMNQLLLDKIDNLAINLLANLAKEMDTFRKKIKQEIRSDLKEINQTVDKLIVDTQKTKQRVEILEFRTEKLESDLAKSLSRKEEELDEKAIWEQKLREKCVKIRGLPEEKNEDLAAKLITEIAKFMKKDPVFFDEEIDKIFRINSVIAKQKGLLRDVAVYFVRKRTRDLFLTLHNETSFSYKNQELKVLKDIPGRILRKRKDYIFLTTFLREEVIPYRWDLPEGLTKISTPEQAKAFLRKATEKNKESNKGESRHQAEARTPRKDQGGVEAESLIVDLSGNEEEDLGGEEDQNRQSSEDLNQEIDPQELLLEEERLRKEDQERESKSLFD